MEDNYFTILWRLLPYINMNQPWVYMYPPVLRPLPLSSPSHPSGLSQSTSFECLPCFMHWTWHWLSILHMVIYTFQCYSLILSHPRLLPHNLIVCSLHLCLFCCLVYRIVVTIFLNSIYMHYILYWCFSFWLTLLCIIGSSFNLIRTDSNTFFFIAE